MRFSVWPNLMQPVEDVLDVARHADRTGWDGVWVADHFMGDGAGFGAVEVLPVVSAVRRRMEVCASLHRRLHLRRLARTRCKSFHHPTTTKT